MLNILVCVKQVPDIDLVRMDPETGNLVRTGVPSLMNPLDTNALEAAIRTKEQYGGTVTTITMGPPAAEAVLREALSVGADRAILASGREFGGADTLSTSYVIVQAAKQFGDYDLIFCGKQTIDGDTAQVGPAIAEHMGIPHAAWVSKLEVNGDGIDVEQQLQSVVETAHMPFPCLVTVEQDIMMPRLPSLKKEREIKDKPIHIQGLDTFLDTNPDHYGLTGSPTQVERIFPPDNHVEKETWQDGDLAQKAIDTLRKWKFI